MIDLTKVRSYYIACGYTGLRLGIDGLAAVVTQQYGGQLNEEGLFLFCGRRTDRIKALYWTGDGYVLIYKRLSNGRFRWPRSEAELKLLDPQNFRWLMEGLRIEQKTVIRKGMPKDLFWQKHSKIFIFSCTLSWIYGYQGYNLLTKVTHCGCWSHARRKWREAMPDGATVKTSKAAVGFQYCNKLFAQERKCAAYNSQYRQDKKLPILEEYYAWLKTVHPEKGSKPEESLRYSLNQKQQRTGISGQRRSTDFQQPSGKRDPPVYPWQKELLVL